MGLCSGLCLNMLNFCLTGIWLRFVFGAFGLGEELFFVHALELQLPCVPSLFFTRVDDITYIGVLFLG